jgi:hypothetical protein
VHKNEARNNGKKIKTMWLAFFLFHFSLFICSAQSTAAEIETLLGTKAVTFAQAARFLLEASDTMVTYDSDAAFRYAQERNWLPKDAVSDKAARLDEVSLLIMNSFGFKGGIMYTIYKTVPQYAYRELMYNNIIQGRVQPAMNVSGDQLLFITGKTLAWKESEN